MAWQTPKTDWATNPKNPKSEDFNRIEGNIDFLKTDIETKKALIVNAISDMNQPALVTDTHLELANKIRSISSDANAAVGDVEKGKTFYAGGAKKTGTLELTGDAATGNVLSGKTFYNNDLKAQRTGTMPSRGAVTITPGQTEQTIPAGYHNGSGKVPAVVFDAAKVLTGTTIAGKTGTMPNRGRAIITPGTTNKPIAQGYHDGTGYVQGDTDLKAANIKKGINVFGVTGAMPERPWFDNWGGEWPNVYWDVVELPSFASISFSAPVGEVRKVMDVVAPSLNIKFKCGGRLVGNEDLGSIRVSTKRETFVLEGNKTAIVLTSSRDSTQYAFVNTVKIPGAVMWTMEIGRGDFYAPTGKEYLVLGANYTINHTNGTNIAENSITGSGIMPVRTWITDAYGINSIIGTMALWGIEKPDNIVPVYGMIAPGTSIKPPANKKWVLWHIGSQHFIRKISTGRYSGGNATGYGVHFILDGNGDYEFYAHPNYWAFYAGVEYS